MIKRTWKFKRTYPKMNLKTCKRIKIIWEFLYWWKEKFLAIFEKNVSFWPFFYIPTFVKWTKWFKTFGEVNPFLLLQGIGKSLSYYIFPTCSTSPKKCVFEIFLNFEVKFIPRRSGQQKSHVVYQNHNFQISFKNLICFGIAICQNT